MGIPGVHSLIRLVARDTIRLGVDLNFGVSRMVLEGQFQTNVNYVDCAPKSKCTCSCTACEHKHRHSES